MLDQVAQACSPSATHNTGPAPVAGMVALVANNPKKEDLESFLDTNKGKVSAKTVTGTASSSTMAVCVTQATKAGFSTESGPWGGDAQLAGLIAAQCKHGSTSPKYLRAVVFFADEDEAHHLDI